MLAVLGGRGGVSGGPSIGRDTAAMVARLSEAAAQITNTVSNHSAFGEYVYRDDIIYFALCELRLECRFGV